MADSSTRSSRISDWAGFTFFGSFAVITLSKMPAVGIFLIPAIAFEFFVAISFLTREPVRATAPGVRARFSAYGGTFLLMVFLQIARWFHPDWLAPTGVDALRATGSLLWVAGSIWTAYSIWYLRSAFSIEPEARCLITSGPYQFARHPLYTGYLVQYGGMWLLFPSIPFAIVLGGWLLLVADRIRHEERVLDGAFPEYADYRRRVGALGSFPHPRTRA
ncbi:MAG: methyltransferase family protein [Vicinamibacterales bacterium]